MKQPAIESILVYSGLDLIGDGLMKLPFLRALREAWPHARITWLAGIGRTVYAGPLAELVSPYLDEVIEDAGIGHSAAELLRRPLPGRCFDLILDTQRRPRTTLILRRIPHRVFVSGAARFWLSDRRPPGRYRKERRMVDAMLRLVALASGQAPRLDLQLSLPWRFTDAAAAVMPGPARASVHGSAPLLAGLAPGAGGTHKRWPLERFVQLAQGMDPDARRPVFLLGPDEAGWAASIRDACPAALLPLQSDALPASVSGSPLFTIACARHLAAAVANDSGTGHMLAAADVPLLSLFGPTDPAKFAPYASCGDVLRAQAFGGADMTAIPVHAVSAALDRLMAAATAAQPGA